MQTAIRQLRIEGATLLYIHKLCNIFFTSVMDTAKEFEMNFAGNTGCYSSFVVWSLSATGMFVDAFSKQVGRRASPEEAPASLLLESIERSLQTAFHPVHRCLTARRVCQQQPSASKWPRNIVSS